MKRHFILLFLLTLFAFHKMEANPVGGVTLTGKITDKKTGEALIGVVVYLPELKSGASTDINGMYSITNLPASKVSVQVTFIGYQTILETVDLSTTTTVNFAMETSIVENEVVITGTSTSTEIKRNPVPIVSINKAYLDRNLSTNVIDAIAKMPGINAVTTGPNVSKPFIRGLGYNRILTLYDGTR